ncbi:YybH family protein [Microbacterium yannicii]|uniref:YybH family protein n=1 Tax=Microbacterium yannicii TaxID=671622 RepID=UPI0002D8CE2C|nr:nuclear transport factor 2 family protein [Microbacterium yannicii]
MTTPDPAAVEAAASAIVDAFAATDAERYFAAFAPDATFVFHPEPHRLDDRAEYEHLWAEWVASGWRVTSCASSDSHVQVFDGGAVFTHTVDTSVQTADGPESYRERESIVFAADGDRLVAVHEHLSPFAG